MDEKLHYVRLKALESASREINRALLRVADRFNLTMPGSQVIVAGVIPATHEIVIERVAGTVPVGRVHELWLIAEGTDAPVSLGLLSNQGITRIRVPDNVAPGVRTGTIAVSEEPPGGSPTGAPSRPIVAAAQFSDI